MKRVFAALALLVSMLALGGCYVASGYSYVRGAGSQGPAYYGQAVPVYPDAYYGAPYYGGYPYGAYAYGAYGCCYTPRVGVGAVWYRSARRSYHNDGRRGSYPWRGNEVRRGSYQGRGDDGRTRPRGPVRRDDGRRTRRGDRSQP